MRPETFDVRIPVWQSCHSLDWIARRKSMKKPSFCKNGMGKGCKKKHYKANLTSCISTRFSFQPNARDAISAALLGEIRSFV
ncbi:MAG: hypothetical protein ACK4E4_06805, partial [Rhodocyclaceae bacterium]